MCFLPRFLARVSVLPPCMRQKHCRLQFNFSRHATTLSIFSKVYVHCSSRRRSGCIKPEINIDELTFLGASLHGRRFYNFVVSLFRSVPRWCRAQYLGESVDLFSANYPHDFDIKTPAYGLLNISTDYFSPSIIAINMPFFRSSRDIHLLTVF